MKNYELSEFVTLLRMGLWSGGTVAGFGYLSEALETEGESKLAEISSLQLGSRVTLNGIRHGEFRGSTLIFSVYEPYTGKYIFFETAIDSNENIESIFESLTGAKGKANPFMPQSRSTREKWQARKQRISETVKIVIRR